MKKTILTLTLIVFVLVLTACNNSVSEATTAWINGDVPSEGDREFSLPTEMQLMLGTVKLDETEYAVDAEQASQLLPLWKALDSLSESDTVAQVEYDALVSQIEDTMTSEQNEAIASMNLTMQDMAGVMETLGVESNFGRFGDIDPEMQATMEAARESGDFPGGGPGGDFPGGGPGGDFPGGGPGGGFGAFGGAEMDPSARETAMAERGGMRGARSGINSFLLDSIIKFLEAKIQ